MRSNRKKNGRVLLSARRAHIRSARWSSFDGNVKLLSDVQMIISDMCGNNGTGGDGGGEVGRRRRASLHLQVTDFIEFKLNFNQIKIWEKY